LLTRGAFKGATRLLAPVVDVLFTVGDGAERRLRSHWVRRPKESVLDGPGSPLVPPTIGARTGRRDWSRFTAADDRAQERMFLEWSDMR